MKSAFLLLCCLAFTPAASAQEIRVKTIVKGKAEVEAQVGGYIQRHLRAWKDIVIAQTEVDVELRIVVIKVMANTGDSSFGYALSVVVTRPLTSHEVESLADSYPQNAQFMRDYFNGRSLLDDHYLYLAQPDRLDALCRLIVEEFNNRHLEPIRKGWRLPLKPKMDTIR
jgi:hypothetical protein